jgi:putative hydrolase of the HAD superfamily
METVPDVETDDGPTRVAAVVFDWYATLAVSSPQDLWWSYPQLVVSAGGHPAPEAMAALERDHPLDHREHSLSEVAYRAWQRDRLGAFASACGLEGQAREAFLDRIDELRYTQLFDVFPDVRPTLNALKARGVTVAVCSNWDWCLDRQLTHNAIDHLCDVVVCSAVVGIRKPHPAIFDLVLDRTNTEPAETLFVGDSWQDDVVGSQAAGLRPVHIARTGDCRTANHDAIPCVTGLDDVIRLCG